MKWRWWRSRDEAEAQRAAEERMREDHEAFLETKRQDRRIAAAARLDALIEEKQIEAACRRHGGAAFPGEF